MGYRNEGGSALTRNPRSRGASLEELRAEASHAAQRLALYRRKVLLGRGDPRQMAGLERISTAAAERLKRARKSAGRAQHGLYGARDSPGEPTPLRYILPAGALEREGPVPVRGRETP